MYELYETYNFYSIVHFNNNIYCMVKELFAFWIVLSPEMGIYIKMPYVFYQWIGLEAWKQ